ncbi:hypothetical protein ACGC1H_003941 [Rhizoctonia solani]
MGTRGYFAYRYQGKYYRMYVHCDAYPSGYGRGVANEIPRNPEQLEKYIKKTTQILQMKKERAKLFFGQEAVVSTGCDWTLGDTFIEWTYVIDFDNRVCTVNGAVHFPFDNMPPLHSSDSELGFAEYLESYERIEIPAKYLKTIDLWPAPRFDVAQVHQQYHQLEPLIAKFPEWTGLTWDTLSVSQCLATLIVKTLVHDYSDELALTHYSNVWHKIGLFCWQVANAAAPSHLICPSLDSTPKNSVLYVRTDLVKEPRAQSLVQTIRKHMGGKGTIGRYCWFRGCLHTFCPRLDQPVYMMHEVGKMVQHLRSYGRTSGVGIIMSGWHMIAVTIDGSDVRHSPVLELHDGKELKDGVLLLIHLLSPAFTALKTPWRVDVGVHQLHTVSSVLPDDVLRNVIDFTDLETYLSLRLVSRCVRLICLAHPRVGHYILLSYEANKNSRPVFRVRSTNSTYPTTATLTRTQASTYTPLPVWRFRMKHYSKCVLHPGLVGTFQYHQSGIGPLDMGMGEENNAKAPTRPERLPFKEMIKGDMYHNMRIQTVDGIWDMVGSDDPVKAPETPRQRGLYERMTGFDTDELQDMSEAEERFHYLSD